jgi:hypothetical protein
MITYGEAVQIAIASNLNMVVLDHVTRAQQEVVTHVIPNLKGMDKESTDVLTKVAKELIVIKAIVHSTMDHYEKLLGEHIDAYPDNEQLIKDELEKHPILNSIQEELLKSPKDRLVELLTKVKMA